MSRLLDAALDPERLAACARNDAALSLAPKEPLMPATTELVAYARFTEHLLTGVDQLTGYGTAHLPPADLRRLHARAGVYIFTQALRHHVHARFAAAHLKDKP
jgi:hypothetical protein